MKILKHVILGISFLACIVISGCTTVTRTTSTNAIKSEQFVLNTFLDRDDYSVIGTATGVSEFVYWDSDKREYTGDSGKYGYISEPEERFVGQADNGTRMYVGVGKKNVENSETGAFYLAKLNANYMMIEEAYKLGGDSIFDPIYSVETISEATGSTVNKVQYKVTVRAKVIQLKVK
ncbi:MAG: hypothetical protein IJ207_04660 [Treponema sp.]|mgnify:FL=1|uniref:hypothetical protein n=1 Tax=Treponema sp. TaxID=166 RepID=UPI0025FF024C|nr:hypothetical protein [Treponema sp.]MBQ9281473.1 hypothetical protein [Treponema sp.]